MAEETPHMPSILITGFGPFLDIKTNPSWTIASRLPSTINGVRIIVPDTPLAATYHSLLSVPKLLEEHQPDVVIHMGLAMDRSYYAIEKGAERDCYHEIPDEERKVVSRKETKVLWGKSPARLDSTVDGEDVLERWVVESAGLSSNLNSNSNSKVKGGGKSKGKGKGEGGSKELGVDLRTSDDVGNYVCGFVYYTSLEWFWKKNGSQGERKVLFFHVPMLKEEGEFERGKDVTVALIKAVIKSCLL